ncbi:helix-hairpin-helix domain-containing protein [Aeribacillus alveayuensis]|jgi:competence protein ComEA|uniref:helix-hairpin-helix domain-containing protein n=1 Tax=Aeribacillus alveayuensis TaxID=279215 RepID=UPI0005CD8791|nr:helix-hairpin-helix domain-containing protein [Bacillus alveayuensis]
MDYRLLFKKYWIVPVLFVIGIMTLVQYTERDEHVVTENEQQLQEHDMPEFEKISQENDQQEEMIIYVDVKGAVKNPGVYEVKETDRVLTVIEKAGGFHENADINQVNLAAKLVDGSIVYVPKIGEQASNDNNQSPSNNKININNATMEELQTLTGIGPSKAEAIISYREENGPFQAVDEIKNVSGIGEKSFEKIKDNITVQ